MAKVKHDGHIEAYTSIDMFAFLLLAIAYFLLRYSKFSIGYWLLIKVNATVCWKYCHNEFVIYLM